MYRKLDRIRYSVYCHKETSIRKEVPIFNRELFFLVKRSRFLEESDIAKTGLGVKGNMIVLPEAGWSGQGATKGES